jgi:hypothetical protein
VRPGRRASLGGSFSPGGLIFEEVATLDDGVACRARDRDGDEVVGPSSRMERERADGQRGRRGLPTCQGQSLHTRTREMPNLPS